ncbi:hypothetical protein LCGC14_2561580 [marine sediment metagenome]|uniref:Uncharacterized protein n=1 Tax=marine sediment metagenome TaxID=412755 RepID=A0A0F9AKG9_9ZZZZ
MNLYEYLMSNALSWLDPSGLETKACSDAKAKVQRLLDQLAAIMTHNALVAEYQAIKKQLRAELSSRRGNLKDIASQLAQVTRELNELHAKYPWLAAAKMGAGAGMSVAGPYLAKKGCRKIVTKFIPGIGMLSVCHDIAGLVTAGVGRNAIRDTGNALASTKSTLRGLLAGAKKLINNTLAKIRAHRATKPGRRKGPGMVKMHLRQARADMKEACSKDKKECAEGSSGGG